MRIFVTGGSGFVGSRLIPSLAAAGHEVLALARSATADAALRQAGAEPVRGDLDQAERLVLPAVEAVVHAAAYFHFAGPRAPYFRTNLAGTQALLAAAEKAGAGAFVFISAAGIIMDDRGTPVRGADETRPTFPDSFSGYIASKARAEAAVLAADRPGFRTIALRPSAIWGPGDPFSRAIPQAIQTRRFAFVDRGDYTFSTCHVDNVVEAVHCALAAQAAGRAFFIKDRDETTFRAFVAGLAGVQGLSIETLPSLPYWAAFNLGRLMEVGAALSGSKEDPALSRTLVRLIGREFTIDDAAARDVLGYVGLRTRAEGLAGYGE